MTSGTRRFVGGEVVLAGGVGRAEVVIEGTRIVAVDAARSSPGDRVIDVGGLRVAPGFVDLQINGAMGFDLAAEPASMWPLAGALPTWGVTSFLPTIVSSGPETITAALAALAAPPVDRRGATPLGLHSEGPMLNPRRRGAHPEAMLRPPSIEIVEGWSRERGVAMVTLAPELPGALDIVRTLRDRGVTVSIGHSEATLDEVVRAVVAGASHVTHLYNAMSPLHHRRPGVVGAGLTLDALTAGIIVDRVHVHPAAVRLAWKTKGPDGLALVSDAVSAMGMTDETGGRTADGTLAGSTVALDAAVRNLVDIVGCPWSEAVRAASTVPAAVIGARSKGRIEPGCDADIVVLDDRLAVVATMVAGRMLHDPHGLAS